MHTENSSSRNILHWHSADYQSNTTNDNFTAQQGSNLAYPDREDIQKIISDLRLLACDTKPSDFRHSLEIDVDTSNINIVGSGIIIPSVEYKETHRHYREERCSTDDNDGFQLTHPNYFRRIVFLLDMGNNRNHMFQSVSFLSRETTTSRGLAEELFKPEARGYLHSFFTIFPSDAEYALMVNNAANVIIAKYGDFSATLVV